MHVWVTTLIVLGVPKSNWSCNANTGVPTFKNRPDSWDEISVMTGVELDQEKELGPHQTWKYDRKSNLERRDKIMAKHKMWIWRLLRCINNMVFVKNNQIYLLIG